MQEWDILSELASRIKQDTAGAWERVQAYYQEIGQSSILADIASLEGLTEFYAADYGITLQDFTYSTPNVVQVPVIARTDTFQNDGDETAQEEFEFSKSIAETFSFSFTEGLKVGAKASAKVGLPLVGEGEVELSAEVTFEANQQWTTTETREWRLKTTVPIPPHQTIKVTGFITNANINATFSGVAKATKGLVLTWFKLKSTGYTEFPVPLVVLLPDDQRSVRLSGAFHGVEGISAYTHVEKVNS